MGALLLALPLSSCGAPVAAADDESFRAGTAERLEDGALRIREDSLPFLTMEMVGEDQVPTLVRAPGRVAFREGAVAEVGASVEGRVTEVHVQLGQPVEAGAPLVSIASPSAAAVRGELARARVMLRAAEAELARQESMLGAGVGIEMNRARAEADVAQARALMSALAAAATSIGRGSAATVVVRAPIAGTVLVRHASVGLAVEAGGEPLIVLGEPGAVQIIAEVFERELPLIQLGAEGRVSIASASSGLRVRVTAIGGAVDAETRRAPIFLSVEGEPAARASLRAGMFARAELEVGDAGLGIPTSSVLVKDGGRTVVFVQREPRTFVEREVELGAPVAGRVPVLAGLLTTDTIVTRGALLLDGQAEILR